MKSAHIMPDAHRSGPGLHCPPSPGKSTHTPSPVHAASGEHRRVGAHAAPGTCSAAHLDVESQKSGGAHRSMAQLPPSWNTVVGFLHFD